MTMKIRGCFGVVALLVIIISGVNSFGNNIVDYVTGNGHRLMPRPSYFVVAPTRVRANEVINVNVIILRLDYPQLFVRASIMRYSEEIAFANELFTSASRRMLQMKMPEDCAVGNYTLKVEGTINQGFGGIVFQNITKLKFEPKRVSVFMFTDKQIYLKRSTIYFRIIVLQPNLLPITSGSMNVYVKDAKGQVIRRWLAQLVNNGYYENNFPTAHPAKHGWWTILVEGWGYTYTSRFRTENVFPHQHEVNVTMPDYILENDFGLAGVIMANHTSTRPVFGNATLKIQVQPPGMKKDFPTITKEFPHFKGTTSFMVPMSEIEKHSSDLPGTKLKATVTVKDWYEIEVQPGKGTTEIIADKYRIRFLGGKVRTFKPGTAFEVYIAVYSPDGRKFRRFKNKQVLIQLSVISATGQTLTKEPTPYAIPADSIVRFTYTPTKDDATIVVRAAYDGAGQAYHELKATRHFSRSGNFLTIGSSTIVPELNSYMVFTIRMSIFAPEVYYEVLSKGRILYADMLYMKSTQKTFAIAVSRDMVPDARVVAFCILNTGEVLADSMSFHVKGIRKNGLKVRVNQGKDFNGKTLEINAIGDPSTLTVFRAEDYDMYKRKSHRLNLFFTEHMVEEELATYDDHQNMRFKHTWYYDEERRENVFFASPSYAIDANTTFESAGVIVYTDADLVRIEGYDLCNYTTGWLPCFDGSCYLMDQRCDGEQQCEDGADEMGCDPGPDEIVSRADPFDNLYRMWVHLEDRMWAWKHFYTMPRGRIDFTLNSPVRPTTWVIGGFSLSTTDGLAFSEEPARLDTTMGFYMIVQTPKTVFRGEQIGVQVAVFNCWHQPIEALVKLKHSKDYSFVKVETDSITSSYDPRTIEGYDVETMVSLKQGESRFVHFPVLPLVIGKKIKITIVAHSFVNSVTVTKSVKVVYDGITNRYHTPYLVDLISKGSVYIPDFQIPVPETFIRPEQREHLFVPGSEQATVSVVGDVVGTGFFKSHLDLYNIYGYVYGNGEHSMFHFGLNFYWLEYLRITDQLTSKVRTGVLTGLNKDLMQMYAFIAKDGGMAMRRKKSPTSVFLTAMTIEVLAAGARPEWEYIVYIDPNVLNRLTLWLVKQQNKTSGAFLRTSLVFDLKMLSNATTLDGVPMNVSETAYSVIAFATAKNILRGDAQTQAVNSMNLAADYLARNLNRLSDAFDICTVTYALHLAHHSAKDEAFLKMVSIKRNSGDNVYWSTLPVIANPTTIVNNVPFMLPRKFPEAHECKAVQASAFALLVYLQNNRFVESRPIMRWLQTMRNFNGGFSASQETMRAVQALAAYAECDTNRALYDMSITFESTATTGWKKTVHLKKGNFGALTTLKLPAVFNTLKATATGTGMALIQMSTTVNVEYDSMLRKPPVRSFDLWVENLAFWGRNSSHFDMNVCIRWTRLDMSPRSGAAVLEVDIPTGFYVRKELLRKFQRVGNIDSMRSRFTKQKVVMYFEYFDNNANCYYFEAERWYPIANGSIQHQIRIYDSYEPALQNTTHYNTYSLFHLHICQVCGSFQCPYCPFYNTAVSVPTTSALGLLLVVAGILCLRAVDLAR